METNSDYQFTRDWFSQNIGIWDDMITQLQPERILEVGAYEGRSTKKTLLK